MTESKGVCPKCGSEKVMKKSVTGSLVLLAISSLCVAGCFAIFIITIPMALVCLLFAAVAILAIPFSFKKYVYVCLDCKKQWNLKKQDIVMEKVMESERVAEWVRRNLMG